MKPDTPFKTILLLLIFFCGFLVPAFGQTGEGNFLESVSSEKGKDQLTIRLEFKYPLRAVKPAVFSKKWVRIEIPESSVRPEKRYFYTGDSWIPQIVVFRDRSESLGVQLVLGQIIPNLSDRVKTEKRKNTLLIRVYKKEPDVLEKFLARAAEKTETSEKNESSGIPENPSIPVAKVSTSRNIKENTVSPVVLGDSIPEASTNSSPKSGSEAKAVESLPPKSNSNEPLETLPTTLRMFGMFSLVLGIMFLIFFVFKKFVLKNTIFGGNDKLVRVLGTGFLGPKKNIVLVEVADEVLVLGISNDNISLLANIRDKEKVEKIKQAGKSKITASLLSRGKPLPNEGPPRAGAPRNFPTFMNYLKQFSKQPTSKQRSVEEVTQQIRRNLGKMRSI